MGNRSFRALYIIKDSNCKQKLALFNSLSFGWCSIYSEVNDPLRVRSPAENVSPGPAWLAKSAHPSGRATAAHVAGGCNVVPLAMLLGGNFGILLSTLGGKSGIAVIVHALSQ